MLDSLQGRVGKAEGNEAASDRELRAWLVGRYMSRSQ